MRMVGASYITERIALFDLKRHFNESSLEFVLNTMVANGEQLLGRILCRF